MQEKTRWPFAELLPHQGPMILLDELLDYDEHSVDVSFMPKADGVFTEQHSFMPTWVGIELMAQSIATYAGVQARLRGELPKVGFLLGTRSYSVYVEQFKVGERYCIRAEKLYLDDSGLAAFQCTVTHHGVSVAEATINVFEPKNVNDYLKEASA